MTTSESSSDYPSPHSLPLCGQTVLVTRAIEQAKSLQSQLEAVGAKVLLHPVIQILPLSDPSQMDDSIKRLARFDRIVFASRNAAKFFIDRAMVLKQIEAVRQTRLSAIGQSTADFLKSLTGEESIETPESSDSDGLAELLLSQSAPGRVLIVRANRGSNTLRERLSESQIDFEEIVAYSSTDIETLDPEIIRQMSAGEIDWVTITSSAIAKSAIHLFGEDLSKSKMVSISPTTSQALREGGFEPSAEAAEYNMPGIVAAIIKATQPDLKE